MTAALRTRMRNLRADRGATAVEFALCFPIVLMAILMTMYGGLYVFYGAMADNVARKVARDISIPTTRSGGTYPDQGAGGQSAVEGKARDAAKGLIPNPTAVTVASTRPDVAPGDEVTVTVSYQPGALNVITNVLWFLPDPAEGITSSASARRE
jgi:Flp pilus assembly protein TadG